MEMQRNNHRLGNGMLLVMLSAAALMLFQQAPLRAEPIRIMPLGDSITSSINGEASYRYWLWKRLERTRLDLDLVGTMWGVGDGQSGIYGDFDQHHEGHPSATTSDILFGVPYWAAQNSPDVVLMLIGANDIDYGEDPAVALANIRLIIEQLRAVNPNVIILWGMLPPSPALQKTYRSFNSRVSRYARAWSTRASPIRVVNLWSGYQPARDSVDGDHPNESGEKKIAARFYTALNPVLKRLSRSR